MYQKFPVSSDDLGIRLDKWFHRNMQGLPHGLLQKNMRKGGIKVSGKKQGADYRLLEGDVIEVHPQLIEGMSAKFEDKTVKPKYTESEAKDFLRTVIYEDENIIAINKPSGLATQGGSGIKLSVDDLLPLLAQNGTRPKLVHRLDKETSGVLLLARTAKVAARLAEVFKGRMVEKKYLAVVLGVPPKHEGIIESKLEKLAGYRGYEQMVESEDGKYSKSHYRVRDKMGTSIAMLELTPSTGRTHQLRVHAASLGCPIVGDDKYGDADSERILKQMGIEPRLHLHAHEISFDSTVLQHSSTGRNARTIRITAPLTGHMKRTVKELGFEG